MSTLLSDCIQHSALQQSANQACAALGECQRKLDYPAGSKLAIQRCWLNADLWVLVYNLPMPVFEDKREELDHFETMMGVPRGRLAVTMDVITDAMALVGQHGVYCQSQRWPGRPVMDVQLVMKSLTDAKELIQSVMEELKKSAAP